MGQTDAVNYRSSTQAKIALFRSLFRGRDDVYARRFESRKTSRAGYAPACANEWVPGVCEKPRIKCAQCPHRRFYAVTDDVIRWHLSGQDESGRAFVAGVYPMLLDETCFFLAADFDKSTWKQDVVAFLETCQSLNVPAAIERSRSGNGAHVWIFFEQAIPAGISRKLRAHLLTETMERFRLHRAVDWIQVHHFLTARAMKSCSQALAMQRFKPWSCSSEFTGMGGSGRMQWLSDRSGRRRGRA